MGHDAAYQEAEYLIEEARYSNATELSFKNLKLTELPMSLGELVSLQSLNLAENKLTSLPEWLSRLTRLQSLDLYKNNLVTLPTWIHCFTNLVELNIRSNKIQALPPSIGQLVKLERLLLFNNSALTSLPKEIGDLARLTFLELDCCKLKLLPKEIGKLVNLEWLDLFGCKLESLPTEVFGLRNLRKLELQSTELSHIPPDIGKLTYLTELYLDSNYLTDLPSSLAQLRYLNTLRLIGNPLNPELAAANEQGLDATREYLRAKAKAQIVLNEAKLILIGEGEVGKSCLLGALRGDLWEDGRPTTHGIEIKPVQVTDSKTGRKITLNGWDFGGQRVYRPTHQWFFSAPAVYLVVWKPREGPQQGFVKEWIKLVKHREPDAKILVVATHGGPGQRQPDVDRQEIWDLFGRDTVIDFCWVDSKPDEAGERRGIAELKDGIASIAAGLPEMGRSVPKRWQEVREKLKQTEAAYLSLERVLEICREHKMDDEEARLFVTISHRLGHLIHYEHDPALRDIVVLKPDWLATAISFVLDDEQTRYRHGLVSFARLGRLWNDSSREEEFRYPAKLHLIFRRLMERFDLSYRVASLQEKDESDGTSLIAQLVPDVRPDEQDMHRAWSSALPVGDEQQVQICRIVDDKGQSATAEGLFYQLIVRLHKFSLGRVNYEESVHWQRGLVLDDDYNGRALLEHVGNDIRITVRAAYPERFLSALTYEVKWLVENFWEGLRCEVMVPCIKPCGQRAPGTGLFEVQKLIESKRRKRAEYPCPVCNEWQMIDHLLRNAPAVRPNATLELFTEFADVKKELFVVRRQLIAQHGETLGRFDSLDVGTQRILSKVDDSFNTMLQTMLDEAKDGPRLFSFQPIDSGFLDLPSWMGKKFRVTLWCEHSRLPLPALSGEKSKDGVYDLELPRDWFVKAAPWLKLISGTLSLVLPVASSTIKVAVDDAVYKSFEKELDLGQKAIESVSKGMDKAKDLLGQKSFDTEHGEATEARGALLRQFHAWLKQKDPKFGGMVRVRNKRQEFLWVHPQFESEY